MKRLLCAIFGHRPAQFITNTTYTYCRRCDRVTSLAREIAWTRSAGR